LRTAEDRFRGEVAAIGAESYLRAAALGPQMIALVGNPHANQQCVRHQGEAFSRALFHDREQAEAVTICDFSFLVGGQAVCRVRGERWLASGAFE
jgi:hypothetical protein